MVDFGRALLLLPTCLAVCSWAPAQTTGRIAGTVKDLTGAVVVSAQVTAVSKSTAEERQAPTDYVGHYVLALLRPGAYRISVTAPGFETKFFDDVTVSITETTSLEVILAVATAPG